MADKLAWGILGAGQIAHQFATGVRSSYMGQLVAVGSRVQERADRFADEFAIPNRHASYEALLTDPDVRAIYVSVPHPFHAEWAIKGAEAGKHILCEKPIGMNHAEAMAIIEGARASGVFLMEAFMYRCHPQTLQLAQLVRDGAIGNVRMIEAAFGYDLAFDATSRQYDPALGGGGILDVGCYPMSMARLLAGAATGKPFAEPLDVSGAAHLGATGVDEWAVATVRFPGDISAQLATGVHENMANAVRLYGSEGVLEVPWPWKPGSDGHVPAIIVRRTGEEPRTINVTDDRDLYGIEADTVAAHIADRQSPTMPWDDTLGNMAALDQWREAVGLVYPIERPEAVTHTVSRRPLTVQPDAPMRYGTLPGIDKKVSRLVMGVDNQRTMPHAAVMFDDFYAKGGTVFDTAWVYAEGQCERLLGQWVKNRGVRDQVVILDKGAHTPFCTPDWLTAQIMESVERLQTEYVDIYLMHRDNPAIPVGEFITVLNEHQRAGRIRIFGASNWSIARVEEANAYATAHGLQGFSVISNNFSLARMIAPPWTGCVSASDTNSRAWLTRTQTPLLPWSSQARGFFTARARPGDLSDPELARCWYSDDNWERKARVERMAAERDVEPVAIALAYVLNQPFPTFPLIGPRALSETRTSLPALGLTLAPDEVLWLNLEE